MSAREWVQTTSSMKNLLTAEDLTSGEILVTGRLVDASNATLFCKLIIEESDGNESAGSNVYKVVYKPIAGERPLWDFPLGNLASREVAAYLLSEFAGLQLVPTTVMRDGPFGPGAVQQWIEVDHSLDVIAFAQGHDPQLRAMALFDYLINNTDRKFGHILLDASGRLFGCDHGVSFHSEYKLRTVLWQFAGSALSSKENFLLNQLIGDWSSLSAALSNYIAEEELISFRARVENLLSSGHFPFPNPEWPSIPWPPV